METSSKFFKNTGCEFYPCHEGIEDVNCLFCYCPLYHYENCGGNFSYTESGCKDCSVCLVPHKPGGYEYIVEFLSKANKEVVNLLNEWREKFCKMR